MNHFDTLTINTVLLRFPSIAKDIFKELDNKSLIKCRKLSVPVQNFIDNEKIIWIRRMQKYNEKMEEFFDQWKRAIRNSPVDNVKELSKAMFQFFEGDELDGKKQYTPLHITASKGLLELSKFIIQKTWDKNPTGSDGYTAFHYAAFWDCTEICRHFIELLDDKHPADKYGMTPLIIAAFKGHLETYQVIAESLEEKNQNGGSKLDHPVRKKSSFA